MVVSGTGTSVVVDVVDELLDVVSPGMMDVVVAAVVVVVSEPESVSEPVVVLVVVGTCADVFW